MPSAAGTPSFVGLVAQAETEVLKGAAAQKPMSAGQMIIGNGTYSDGTATGLGIFLVLRQASTKVYVLAPFGSDDGDWSKWLADKSHVKAVLWRNESDPIPKEDELLRRWRVVSEKGEAPQKSDYSAFGKTIADGILKKWEFLNELVVSEKPPPEAATDPFYR